MNQPAEIGTGVINPDILRGTKLETLILYLYKEDMGLASLEMSLRAKEYAAYAYYACLQVNYESLQKMICYKSVPSKRKCYKLVYL